MDKLYKLNFPIETDKAYQFWESRHRLNRIKAIIAFSLDLDNANDNLRRAGYYRQYRKRYLDLYDCIVNNPKMDGSDGKGDVPFSTLDEHWWNPIAICPLGQGTPSHPDKYPRFVNDSHTAAPWNPIYVSDTEWKLDNTTASTGTIRYFAVWYVTHDNLDNASTTVPEIEQAKVVSWHSSDESVVSVAFTGTGANVANSRNFHFKTMKTGTATLTATTDKGEVIKLYVGVGKPADVSVP